MNGIHQKMKINRESINKILEESNRKLIEKGQQSLLSFVRYTKEDYDVQWFHKVVCAYLDKLERGEIKKLMIFIPPQHGKSELSSRRFPVYALGRNPKLKIGIASYASDLSMSFNRDCQNIMATKQYKDLFPDVYLNSPGAMGANGELKNNHIFETVKHRGFLKAVGVRSALTGTPLDIGIIDDPFKDRQEANSQQIRDSVWDWYQDTFLTRLHNGSKQLLLFTRWHEDDIAGRILNKNSKYYDEKEASEWTVIAIPVLKEATKPLPEAKTINDPRQIDEALWEERHSAEKYYKRRKINPSGFTSMDQQRPTAEEGNKIKKEWLQIINENELPFDIKSITPDFIIDGAYTEQTKNDETALMAVYHHKPNGNMYILNCEGIRMELYELLIYFKKYALRHGYKPTSKVKIELKASGHPLKSMLSKVEYGGFNAIGINTKVVALGKFNRVENSEPTLASEKVFLVKGSWNTRFIEQCCAFPNGVNDDMVDDLTYAVHEYYIKKSASGVSYQ